MWLLLFVILLLVVAYLIFLRYDKLNLEKIRFKFGKAERGSESMYLMDGLGDSVYLYIPKEDRSSSLENIMVKYDLMNVEIEKEQELSNVPTWLQELFLATPKTNQLDEIIKYSIENEERFNNPKTELDKMLNVKNFKDLIFDAKTILKKYAPNDYVCEHYNNSNLDHLRKDEQQKRIFSSNYLREIVKDNPDKFSLIKFPERYIIIKHEDKILNRQETYNFIDENFRFVISRSGTLKSEFKKPDYEIIICSTYFKPNLTISDEALEQLKELCKISPFDTSAGTGGNIFGIGKEAYIIDGKNKSTGSTKLCINNLISYKE